MKYIFIIALLILTITTRSVHKNEDDKMTKCIQTKCRDQAIDCAQTEGCADNLRQCSLSLEEDKDFEKFDTCLNQVKQSYSLMECIFEKCGESERKGVKQLLEKMN